MAQLKVNTSVELGLDQTAAGVEDTRLEREGLCGCGCQSLTAPAPWSDYRRGWVKGKPIRFVHGHNRRKSSFLYLEEDRGYETKCWVWQRARFPSGYGSALGPAGKVGLVHRMYWEQINGPVPEGLELDHLCRIRACVNPDHVEPVTHAENVRRSPSTKLRSEDIPIIRERLRGGEAGIGRKLGREYGVSEDTISKIKHGHTWRDA